MRMTRMLVCGGRDGREDMLRAERKASITSEPEQYRYIIKGRLKVCTKIALKQGCVEKSVHYDSCSAASHGGVTLLSLSMRARVCMI